MNTNTAVVITGAAPLSLGEGIVHEILNNYAHLSPIVIDKIPNRSLETTIKGRGVFIQKNLNPFGQPNFEDQIVEILEKNLRKLRTNSIGALINNAGIYDFGPIDELPYNRIENLLNVNALGHIGMLRAVMRVNQSRGIDNKKYLRLCEVGSFQGLMPRGGRSIYCFTKGGMIDFCQALANGELEHVVYIAPPSIDTPMLHFNHWVTKVHGDEMVWEKLYRKNLGSYQSVFLNCDRASADAYFQRFHPKERQKLLMTLDEYKEVRNQYLTAPEGVATVTESANTVMRYAFSPSHQQTIVFNKVVNDISGRQYLEFKKDLLYEGHAPFSKRALMES